MNPSTGTFISMDPAQGSIFDPVSLHKYLYANANPVMNCDPSGLFSLAEMGTAMAMQAVIGAAVGAIIGDLTYLADGGRSLQGLGYSILSGAIGGAVFGALCGGLGSAVAQTGFEIGKILLASIWVLLGAGSSTYFGSRAYQEYKTGNILGAIIYSTLAVASAVLTVAGLLDIHSAVTGSASKVGAETTRVGQWMSKTEYEQFVKTGEIPRTNVLTKGMDGYSKQAYKCDYYVEFDIDSSLLVPKNEELGWSLIKSKNQMYIKLYQNNGLTLPEPIGTNITHLYTK